MHVCTLPPQEYKVLCLLSFSLPCVTDWNLKGKINDLFSVANTIFPSDLNKTLNKFSEIHSESQDWEYDDFADSNYESPDWEIITPQKKYVGLEHIFSNDIDFKKLKAISNYYSVDSEGPI